MKKVSVMFALLCLAVSGCTQAVGTIEGETYRDMKVSSEGSAPSCDTSLLRDKDTSLEGKIYMGKLKIEGPVWINKEEMEAMALQKGCENKATVALLTEEHYSVPFIGSWAEVELYR